MASDHTVRNGRKRANSAVKVVNAKKVKAGQSIGEHGRGSVATPTDHNEVNGYTNGGSPASRTKPKVGGNDVSINHWSKEVVLMAAGQRRFGFGLP